jgi:hypothetical protein
LASDFLRLYLVERHLIDLMSKHSHLVLRLYLLVLEPVT